MIELSGILLLIVSIFLLTSIVSYSPSDPNFIYTPENVKIKNIGGFYGSVVSDFLLQSIGLISFFVVLNLFNWGFSVVLNKKIQNFIPKLFYTVAYIILGTTFINVSFNDSFWLINNGNSGFVGRIIKENFYAFTNLMENQYIISSVLILSIIFLSIKKFCPKLFLAIFKSFINYFI